MDLHWGGAHGRVDGILPFFLEVTHCQEREKEQSVSEIRYKSDVVGMYYMCRAIRRERRAEAGNTCGDQALISS